MILRKKKINKIDKSFPRLIQEKSEVGNDNNTDETGDITTDTTDIKSVVKKHND